MDGVNECPNDISVLRLYAFVDPGCLSSVVWLIGS